MIALSFADVKENTFTDVKKKICQIIRNLYNRYDFLLKSSCLNDDEKEWYWKVSAHMEKFLELTPAYNDFLLALLEGDLDAMNTYMNRVSLATFGQFDTEKQPSEAEPERFYHGFVLGLMVDLADQYTILSNRESGFGRYDVMLEPKDTQKPAFILEFKVRNSKKEK